MKELSIIRIDRSVIPSSIDRRDLVCPNYPRAIPDEYDIRKLVVHKEFQGMLAADIFRRLADEKLLQYALDAYDLEAIMGLGIDCYRAQFHATARLLAPRSAWRGRRMLRCSMTFPMLVPAPACVYGDACPEDQPLTKEYLVVTYQG